MNKFSIVSSATWQSAPSRVVPRSVGDITDDLFCAVEMAEGFVKDGCYNVTVYEGGAMVASWYKGKPVPLEIAS